MKRKLLQSAAIVAVITGTPAFAADLPVIEPAPVAPIVAAPLWSGFYVGLQVGAAFDIGGRDLDCDVDDFSGVAFEEFLEGGFTPAEDTDFAPYAGFGCDDVAFSRGDDDDNSWVAGAHIGYDMQVGSWVFGGVIDANWIDNDDDGGTIAFDPDEFAGGQPYSNFATLPGFPDVWTISPPDFDAAEAGLPYQEISFNSGLQWYGTTRGRIGWAPGAGRFLVYGTGGLAFGEFEAEVSRTAVYTGDEADRFFSNAAPFDPDQTEYAPGGPLPDGCSELVAEGGAVQNRTGVVCRFRDSEDDFKFGFALGAGLEFLVTDNFSIGAEYLYVNLGDADFDAFNDFRGDDDDLDFQTITVRGSFRFGG